MTQLLIWIRPVLALAAAVVCVWIAFVVPDSFSFGAGLLVALVVFSIAATAEGPRA